MLRICYTNRTRFEIACEFSILVQSIIGATAKTRPLEYNDFPDFAGTSTVLSMSRFISFYLFAARFHNASATA